MSDTSLRRRLQRRFFQYSGVGIATYLLDIALLFTLLTLTAIPQPAAIALSFLFGVTTNFLACYYWVYRGTEQHELLGYIIFVGVAGIGVALVTLSTEYLATDFGLNIYLARTSIAAVVGLINFSINTFLNFRVY